MRPRGSLSDCVTEKQVNCVPPPRPLCSPPHYDPRGPFSPPAGRATASAVLLKAGLARRHCTWAEAFEVA